jgi:hypothetical protein
LSMGLTCSAVILTTSTPKNVGDTKMRRAHLHAPAGPCREPSWIENIGFRAE